MTSKLIPQILTCFREGYTGKALANDLVAGLVTGIVALPLSIAFAIASGVKPEQGLYTAIVAGFLISVFSGSRVQIGGPTGAFVVIIYGIVQRHGPAGLAVATLTAGALLVTMGLIRLGWVLKYLPYPLIVGFTSGIAVIIALGQVPALLGIPAEGLPADALGQLAFMGRHLGELRPATAALGLLALAILALWPRVSRRIPASIVALAVATVAAEWMDLPVATIGSRFGAVPSGWPPFAYPELSLGLFRATLPDAVAIALLAGIESLLSAVVADGMTGRRHRANMELIAQGIANLASPLFGGIPATGAIARTATNIKNGGTTPVAGIAHAFTLLAILLLFGRHAARIPMTALAAILLIVAYHMSEWRTFIKLFRAPRSDVSILLTVFLLTVFADLTVAIEIGVILSAFLFMRRMETVTVAGVRAPQAEPEEEEADDAFALDRFRIPEGVEVFEIEGPFFFGAAGKFQDALERLHNPRVLILRLRRVPAIDATGLRILEETLERTRRHGGTLLISGIHRQPVAALRKAGLTERIGRSNIHKNVRQALRHAAELVGQPPDAVERTTAERNSAILNR